MTLQYSTTVRNAKLDAIETAISTSPILTIRTGAAPAHGESLSACGSDGSLRLVGSAATCSRGLSAAFGGAACGIEWQASP